MFKFFSSFFIFISFDINCILVWLTYNDNYDNYQPWSYIFLFHFFISFYINLYTSQTTYNDSEGYSDHYTIYSNDHELVRLHTMTLRATVTTTLSTAMTTNLSNYIRQHQGLQQPLHYLQQWLWWPLSPVINCHTFFVSSSFFSIL